MTSTLFCVKLNVMKSYKNRLGRIVKIIDELDNFSDLTSSSLKLYHSSWHPLYDLFITEKNLVIVIELPGVEKDDFILTVSPRGLLIRGRRHAAKAIKQGKIFYNLEIPYGNFERRIPFPIDVQTQAIEVDLSSGLLTITLPLKAHQVERVIPIEEG